MRMRSDEELMRKLGLGSSAAFDELFKRHGGRVLGYCARIVGDKALGEDIAQEVWIRVAKAAPDYRPSPGASLRSWLLTISRNLALNDLRKRKRLVDWPEEGDAKAEASLDLERESVEQILIRETDRARVAKAIDGLEDAKRTALMLWMNEEMSHEEIAKELGSSAAAVKSLLFRARRDLENELSSGEEEES